MSHFLVVAFSLIAIGIATQFGQVFLTRALVLERAGRAGPLPGFEVWRQGRAGQVAYQLLKRAEGALS